MTLTVLRSFRRQILSHKVEQVIALGTAAMRATKHTPAGKKFHAATEIALGHKIQVISGRHEALLMAEGVRSAWPNARGVCADLGGGSLELANLNAQQGHTATMPLGTLAMLYTYGNNLIAAAHTAERQLGAVRWLRRCHGRDLYVVGGSWRTIGRLILRQKQKAPKSQKTKDGIHGLTMAPSTVQKHLCAIIAQPPEALKKLPKKLQKRADVIPIAAVLLLQLITTLRPRRIIFSAYGLRDGALRQALVKN